MIMMLMVMTVGNDDDTNEVGYFQVFRLLWNLTTARMANCAIHLLKQFTFTRARSDPQIISDS